LEFEPELPAGFGPPPGWEPAPPIQPPQTSVVDLRKTPEELLESFKPKTRYNVRLASKKGVVAARSDDLAAFAKLSSETSARHGIHLADEGYYRAVHELFGADGSSRLYLAHHEGDCLAGIMVMRFGGRATYLFGASANRGRDLMPAYAVHWQAMQESIADGDHEYDLWGVPPPEQPDHPWAGLTQFKAGWQGTYVAYAGAFALPLRPRVLQAHRGLSRIRSSVRQARNRLGR
jgi:lipid II:glycine glycyltransferase (peptidoglycan interpeptide bridge formation enzyme)